MISRRGSVWWLDLYVGGKRVRRSLHTRERAVAIERARDVTAELGQKPRKGTQYVDFLSTYYEYCRTSKPTSCRVEKYQGDIMRDYFKGRGLLNLEEVSTQEVERLRAWLLTRPIGKSGKRTMSRTTANRYLAQLRTMFNKAKDWGLYHGDNPVSRVKFYREGAKVRPLSEEEITRVLAAAENISRDKYTSPTGKAIFDICRLVLNTGLRRSEALNLRWSDIIDGEARVRGKGGKVRMVPLNAEARAVLDARPKATAYVFDIANRNAPQVLRRVTETISRNAKVPFHLHLLRHAFASRLLAAGVDVVTISQLLGHGAYMTTLLYAHSNPQVMREAVTKIGHGQVDVRV